MPAARPLVNNTGVLPSRGRARARRLDVSVSIGHSNRIKVAFARPVTFAGAGGGGCASAYPPGILSYTLDRERDGVPWLRVRLVKRSLNPPGSDGGRCMHLPRWVLESYETSFVDSRSPPVGSRTATDCRRSPSFKQLSVGMLQTAQGTPRSNVAVSLGLYLLLWSANW